MVKKSMEEMVQRALDYQEIQNIMSRHGYYHSTGMEKEEMEEIWAKKTPGVTFAYNWGVYEGIESVKGHYLVFNELRGQRTLEDIRKLYPEIEDDPENHFIGSMVMHTLTTPVIEVAEDGSTAKGVWVSPGHMTGVRDGKLRAYWFWERYGVDFVKEDRQWKIWHFHVYTDFLTPYEKSWVEGSIEASPQFPKPDKDIVFYKAYSPKTVPQYIPRSPEPYETFDETAAY